jgi:hypothetical protein
VCRTHPETPDPKCSICNWFAYQRKVCLLHPNFDGAECVDCKRCVQVRARAAELAKHRRTPNLLHGVDLHEALDDFMTLPVFKDAEYRTRPRMHVRWAQRGGGGRAFTWSQRMVVSVSPDTTLARALIVVLHELVHCSLPTGESHSERFTLRMIRAIREKWGIMIPDWRETPRGNHKVHTYAIEARYEKILHERITRGEIVPRKAVEPEPAPVVDLDARRAEMVRKRAEKAARMLERAERRQKAAARLVQKWRAKVRYYERTIAAKKGS